MKIFIVIYLAYYILAKYFGLFYDESSKLFSDITLNWLALSAPFLIVYLLDKIYECYALKLSAKLKLISEDNDAVDNLSEINERLTKLEKKHDSMYTFVADALKTKKSE